jgi:hypothetical protein
MRATRQHIQQKTIRNQNRLLHKTKEKLKTLLANSHSFIESDSNRIREICQDVRNLPDLTSVIKNLLLGKPISEVLHVDTPDKSNCHESNEQQQNSDEGSDNLENGSGTQCVPNPENNIAAQDKLENLEMVTDFIVNQIKLYSAKRGNPNSTCRYSPRVLHMAMAIYSRSRSAYNAAKESGILQLPAVSTVKRYMDSMKCREGRDLDVYVQIYHAELEALQKVKANRKRSEPVSTIGTREISQKTSKTAIADLPNEKDGVSVILMLDEMKLSEGLYWSAHTHTLHGFADSELEFSSILDDLMDVEDPSDCPDLTENGVAVNANPMLCTNTNTNTETDKRHREKVARRPKLAAYVNQWKVVTEDLGNGYALEFFASSVPVNASALASQLRHVMLLCSIHSIHIRALCADSNSTNRKLFDLLCEREYNPNNGFLEDDDTFFPHPCTGKKVYVFNCSVHVMKAVRNNLFAAQKNVNDDVRTHELNEQNRTECGDAYGETNSTQNIEQLYITKYKKNNTASSAKTDGRELKYGKDYIGFGWHVIERLWENEKIKTKQGNAARTSLSNDIVNLNSWSKMKVGLAKRVMDAKIVGALTTDAIRNFNIPVEAIDWSGPDELDTHFRQRHGQSCDGVQSGRLDKLEEIYPELKQSPELQTAKFLARLNDYFVEFFLCKGKKITKENREHVRSFVKNINGWFLNWRRTLERENTNPKTQKWKKQFLANDTWRNMVAMSSGFVNYAIDATERCHDWFYVPMLNSNQSSLEAHFSNVRSVSVGGAVTIQGYEHANTIVSIKNGTTALKRGRTYDINDIHGQSGTLQLESNYKKQKREQMTLKKLEWQLEADSINRATLGIRPFSIESSACPAVVVGWLVEFFQDQLIIFKIRELPFTRKIIESTSRIQDQSTYDFLLKVLVPENEDQLKNAEELWQDAVTEVIKMLMHFSDTKTTKKQKKTNQNVHDNQNPDDEKAVEVCPDLGAMYLHYEMNPYLGWTTLNNIQLSLVTYMAMDTVRDFIKTKTKLQLQPVIELSREQQLVEVYIFFGYAIQRCRKITYSKKSHGKTASIYTEMFELFVAMSDVGNTYKSHESKLFSDGETVSDTENSDTDEEKNLSNYTIKYRRQNSNAGNSKHVPNPWFSDPDFSATARDLEPLEFSARNKGGLTRPVPETFEFAKKALRILRQHMFQKILHRDSLSDAYVNVVGDFSLSKMWAQMVEPMVPGISSTARDLAFTLALEKLIHSRGGAYIKEYQSNFGASHAARQGVRTLLKAYNTVSSIKTERSSTIIEAETCH